MMDNLLPGLVAFPLLAGLVLLFVGNDALRRVSPEYRDLVRLYFQELSKEAGK